MTTVASVASIDDYLAAARRKIRVAHYHLDQLDSLLDAEQTGQADEVPIEVQAHFEGVLYSFMGATDQTSEAIKLKFGLPRGLKNMGKVIVRLRRSDLSRQLAGWWEEPITTDVWKVRVDATHHCTEKTAHGPEGRWEIGPRRCPQDC